MDLADAAGLSRSKVARVESGDVLRVPLGDLLTIAVALGADLDVFVRWRGEGLDRLLDAAHAALVELTVRLLEAFGWEVAVETSFNVDGERGSIDVLGWHPGTATLLVVEVKSVVPDVQAMLVTHDRKVRLAPRVALARGWRPERVGRLLVIGDTSVSRRRVQRTRSVFEVSYPHRVVAIRRWLRDPVGEGAAGGGAAPGKAAVEWNGSAVSARGVTSQRPFSGMLFLPYAQGMDPNASPRPRQRIRKRAPRRIPTQRPRSAQ